MKKFFYLFGIITILGNAKLEIKERELLDKYVEATRANAGASPRDLLHSKSLSCINEKNKDFYDKMFTKITSMKIPAVYKLKVEASDPELAKKQVMYFFGPDAHLPVLPIKTVTIEYDEKDLSPQKGCSKFHLVADKTSIHMINLAPDGEQMKMVFACVGESALTKLREKPKSIAMPISTELKEKLIPILKSGKFLSAIKLYEEYGRRTRTESVADLHALCDEI
jgi:hypothetical protein